VEIDTINFCFEATAVCLLAIYFRAINDAPLVVGANREEAYARGGTPPQILGGPCSVVAGIDPVAGGTWLGVNQYGLLAAVTNRPKSQRPANPRSRGLLLREILNCADAKSATELAGRELGQSRYAGCNLVCADKNDLLALQAGDWLRIRALPPGLHAVTSHDVNDASDRRLGHALWWLGQRDVSNAESCVQALKELCAQTGNGGPPICLRGDHGGTVSSSIIALRSSLSQSTYLHAQGPPDRTPFEDYSPLLRQLHEISES
jgi:uncharacterized protein with NRDE domain